VLASIFHCTNGWFGCGAAAGIAAATAMGCAGGAGGAFILLFSFD